MQICPTPYHHFEIFSSGDVFPCCPAYCRQYSLGNLLEQDMAAIWRGARARAFRAKLEAGDYSGCDLQACTQLWRIPLDELRQKYFDADQIKMPETVIVSYDRECNLSCRICRSGGHSNSDQDLARCLRIENNLLPWLQECKTLCLSGCGDPFGSRYGRGLIERASKRWPHLKFDFITNGLCLTPKLYQELGLAGRVVNLRVSIHAATSDTYRKVTRSGNLEKLLANLEFLGNLRRSGEIPQLKFNFVVYDENYREMPEFVRFAKKYCATPSFTKYQLRGDGELRTEYQRHAVFEPKHPLYADFMRILALPELQDAGNYFDGGLKRLAEQAQKTGAPANAVSASVIQDAPQKDITARKLFCFCLLLSIDHGRCDEDNLFRAGLQLTSLSIFAQQNFDIYIVTPRSSFARVKNLLPRFHNLNYQFIEDEEILPNIGDYGITTWYKQQYLKLAVSRFINADFYMLLDADIICINPILVSNFIAGGKSYLRHYKMNKIQTEWYTHSAKILDAPFPGADAEINGVTPNIMNVDISSALLNFLQQKYDRPAAAVLLSDPSLKWSEYSLYYLFALKSGMFTGRHQPFDNYERAKFLSAHTMWLETPKENFYDLDIDDFEKEGKEFVCIQSIAKLPIADVFAKFDELFKKKNPNATIVRETLDNIRRALDFAAPGRDLASSSIWPHFFSPGFKPVAVTIAEAKGRALVGSKLLRRLGQTGKDSEQAFASCASWLQYRGADCDPMAAFGDWRLEYAYRDLLSLLWPHDLLKQNKIRIGEEHDGYVMAEPGHDGIIWACDYEPEAHWMWRKRMLDRRFAFKQKGGKPRKNGSVIAAELKEAMTVKMDGPGQNVLFLDLAGDEWEMLAALTQEAFGKFEQIICRFTGLLNTDKIAPRRQILRKIRSAHMPIHIHYDNRAEILMFSNFLVADIMEVTFCKKEATQIEPSARSFPGALDAACDQRFPDLFIGSCDGICAPLHKPDSIPAATFGFSGDICLEEDKKFACIDEAGSLLNLARLLPDSGQRKILVMGAETADLRQKLGHIPLVEFAPGILAGASPLAFINSMIRANKIFDAILVPESLAAAGLDEFWLDGAADMDLAIMTQLKMLLPLDGLLMLAIPPGTDTLIWRRSRTYGSQRLLRLLRGWNRLQTHTWQGDASAAFVLTPNPLSCDPPESASAAVKEAIGQLAASAAFDAGYYAETYPDTLAYGRDAVSHYVLHGALEGRNPAPWFNTEAYLAANPHLQKTGANPFLHYLKSNFQSRGAANVHA